MAEFIGEIERDREVARVGAYKAAGTRWQIEMRCVVWMLLQQICAVICSKNAMFCPVQSERNPQK